MYEIFVELLQKHKVSAFQVCKATGIAPATISDWKSGKSTPKNDKLQKIAKYFNVTLDYLSTGKEPVINAPVSEEDIKIALFGGDGEVTDAMWEEARSFARFIMERERKKNDNKQ